MNIRLIPDLAPIEDAMKTVSSIGVVMLGSLPAAELLRRALSKPLMRLGRKLGMKRFEPCRAAGRLCERYAGARDDEGDGSARADDERRVFGLRRLRPRRAFGIHD